jgi:DNA-binding transcriptional ArsR family regulator
METIINNSSEQLSELSQQRHNKKAKRLDLAFVKGPIPLKWIQQAAKIKGKALAVATAIRYRAGIEKRKKDLKITGNMLQSFGVNRKARYRALKALKNAGLVEVKERRGTSPLVTIIEQLA